MAWMLPQFFDADRTPPGEQHVFRLLGEAPATWVVMHQVHLAQAKGEAKTEIDFLIIAKELGLLVIEVKSHPVVTYDAQGWRFGSRRSTRGPFEQADDGAKTLQRRFAKELPTLRSASFQRCVLFPLARFSASSAAWHPWEWLDRDRLAQLSSGVELTHWLSESLRKSHFMQAQSPRALSDFPASPRPLLSSEVESIVDRLRPHIRRQRPKELMTIRQRHLEEASASQARLLETLEDNSRLLVQGPAGTGKTVIALEALRRWSGPARRHPALICFNRLLGAALKSIVRGWGADTGDPFVGTIHSLMLRCARESHPPPNAGHAYWTEELPLRAMETVLDGKHGIFVDSLIIDEAQDIISNSLYLDFLECLLGAPFPQARWLILADFDRQLIYAQSAAVASALERVTTSGGIKCCTDARLRENCRNTREIGGAAELYSGAPTSLYSGYLRADGGAQDVSLRPFDSRQEMYDALQAGVNRMRDAGIPSNDIALLSCCPISSADRQSLESRVGAKEWYGRGSCVGFETVQRFKGLEAAGVILFNVGEEVPAPVRQLMYVGCTRATMMLWILVERRASQWILEQVEAGLSDSATVKS